MCTHIALSVPSAIGEPSGKTQVTARAMEMPGVIEQSLYVMPKGQQWPLQPVPFVTEPYTWTSAIDFVGIAASGETWDTVPNFCDGLNTSGLSVGALWLEPGTVYPTADSAPGPQVSFFDFPAWILGTCSTVGEVAMALQDANPPALTVVGPPATGADSGYFRPLHYIVCDNMGASIVVEFSMGETQVYDNPSGAMTNAPTFDFQMTNVSLYENLTLQGGATSTTGAGAPLGSSLLGLPGDQLSASRFIRAYYLSQGFGQLPPDGTNWLPAPGGMNPGGGNAAGYAPPDQTAVVVAMQLVQICMGTPYGMLLEAPPAGSPTGTYPTVGDYTMWTSVRDHTNLAYYFVSAFSAILAKIDLDAIDFAAVAPYPSSPSLAVLPQGGAPWCVDATSALTQVETPVP